MTPLTDKVLIWDWSLRVFHWLFAASISLALGIALLAGEHSPLFKWHMLAGIFAGFLLCLRLILFVFGSSHARMSAVVAAFRNFKARSSHLLTRSPAPPPGGHNPVAWCVYLLMFVLLIGSLFTGFTMSSDTIEEAHELFAYGLLAAIALHFCGLLLHALRFKENSAAAMLSGRKRAPTTDAIPASHPLLALALLGFSVLFASQLLANFNDNTKELRIPWIGLSVTLGEHEQAAKRPYLDDDHEHHDDH